jgi:hypothetical protein
MSIHLVTGYKGSAHITSANHGAYNAALVGNGKYVLDSGEMFSATTLSANKIRIYDGVLLNQGRHIQIDPDTYEEVDIENGTQGRKRNDIIVMRYSKNAETGIETPSLVVIKGTPVEANPVDPAHTEGNILNGDLVDDMPLYRVPLDGLTVGELVPLFEIKPSMENMIISDLDEMLAITEKGKYIPDAKVVGEALTWKYLGSVTGKGDATTNFISIEGYREIHVVFENQTSDSNSFSITGLNMTLPNVGAELVSVNRKAGHYQNTTCYGYVVISLDYANQKVYMSSYAAYALAKNVTSTTTMHVYGL